MTNNLQDIITKVNSLNPQEKLMLTSLAMLGIFGGGQIEEHVLIHEDRPAPETEASLSQFKDQIVGLIATIDDVDHLKETWNANIGRLDNIKEHHAAVYRHIRDKFTQRRETIESES